MAHYFRKAAQGLAAIVAQELGRDPFQRALYAFSNRQRNKIKCLYREDNGFVLYYKALAEEKFHWPTGDDAKWTTDQLVARWL